MGVVVPELDMLDVDPPVKLDGGAFRRLEPLLGSGGSGEDEPGYALIFVLVVLLAAALLALLPFAVPLLVLPLGEGAYAFKVFGGGGMVTLSGPFIGSAGIVLLPAEEKEAFFTIDELPIGALTCWIGEEDNRLLPAPEDVSEEEPLIPIGLDMPLGLVMFAAPGMLGPLGDGREVLPLLIDMLP